MKKIGIISVILFASLQTLAQEVTPFQPDTSVVELTQHSNLQLPAKKSNIVTRVLNYFKESNKEKKTKNFDISFIGGPHYSTDTKLAYAIVASGL